MDIDLVKEIEYEFSCKGYYSPVVDRSGEGIEGCSKILMQRFGPQLFYIAKIVLFSRLAQMVGVLAHTFIFNCITIHDIQQYIYGVDDSVRSSERNLRAVDRGTTTFRRINT
ncbi:10811_t:CDS:2, partial [Acaulospora morrowiae]